MTPGRLLLVLCCGLTSHTTTPTTFVDAAGDDQPEIAMVMAHVKMMSVEMGQLKSQNEWLQEMAERLSERVDELEMARTSEPPGAEGNGGKRGRRRIQSSGTCALAEDFMARNAAAMNACCPGNDAHGGGKRRSLQANCALPATCPSIECAAVFVPYFEDCGTMLGASPSVPMDEFRDFYSSCQELQSGRLMLQQEASPAMIFHVLVVDDDAAPPPPPPPAPGANAVPGVVQEYRRVCTRRNLGTCAPPCNSATYGFLLSIEIDGRGTVMACNKHGAEFSWQGQASLGGYIGCDTVSLVSSILSGAAGTFLGTLSRDADIRSDVDVRPGQAVLIAGASELPTAPVWGSGGFTVNERASLSLTFLHLLGAVLMSPGSLSVTIIRCVVAESVFLGGLSVPVGAELELEGPMSLTNTTSSP